MSHQKRYHIEIWGCQMNVADAAAAARRLESMGYVEVPDPAQADLVLLETCCVREKPEHKVYSRLGELRPFKEARPSMWLGVCGCMAQKEGKKIIRNAPFVDLVIGPRRLSHLPEILDELERSGKPQIDVVMEEEPGESEEQDFALYQRQGALKAFVNIIEGCNYRCAYCIVPYVRGKFTSRHPDAVTDEVKRLVDVGIKEVNLLGQSVLAYGRDRAREYDIVDLFERLHEIDGLERIRFTTNHPLEVTDRIIDAVANMPKVMEHFHMPVQAGDDRLLKAMKRGYTVARYEELLAKIRERIPGVSVTSDVIVGFPGETDEMFQHCLDTYRRLAFDQQFMFVYSPRPGTPAATLPDQVPHEVKVARMKQLVDFQNSLSAEQNARQAGQVFEVLVEGPSERDPEKFTGRARNDKALVFTVPAEYKPKRGETVHVVAEAGHLWGFSGRLLVPEAVKLS
ncbi:MAG TPA: tRNA (N6-isopentenyl adenosine(37)-C2)-methylthiotransferase MiaB [Armatimonadota bacterium]|nr:tRNA (N6-isopentenyl adenosine(37)-C2)-methylthiotransferase MiaB [Armatimonadota bacterium]